MASVSTNGPNEFLVNYRHSDGRGEILPLMKALHRYWLRAKIGLERTSINTGVGIVTTCHQCGGFIGGDVSMGPKGLHDVELFCEPCQGLTIVDPADTLNFVIGGDQ